MPAPADARAADAPVHLAALHIAARDRDAARTDLERLLGIAPGAALEVGGVALELVAVGSEAAEGLVGMALCAADAPALRARLAAAGVALVESGAPGADGARLDPRSTRGLAIWLREGAPASPRAPAATSSRARPRRLDHVVVATDDHAAALALYRDALGLRLALDRRFPERGLRILFLQAGEGDRRVTLEVAGPIDARGGGAGTDRFGGLAWRADDVEAWRERLASEGFPVSALRRGFKPGTRVATVTARTAGVPTLLIGDAPRGDAPDGDAPRGDAPGAR